MRLQGDKQHSVRQYTDCIINKQKSLKLGQAENSNIEFIHRDSLQVAPKIPINMISSAKPNSLMVQGTYKSQVSKSQRLIPHQTNTETRTLTQENEYKYQHQQQMNSFNPQQLNQPDNDKYQTRSFNQQPIIMDLTTIMGFDRKQEMHIDKNSNEPLRFGAVISINPFDQPMKFIMSDGFIKNKTYIKDLSYSGNGSIFDRCLFRVYPSFKSKYLRELLEKFQEMEKAKKKNQPLATQSSFFRKQTTESKITTKKEKLEQQRQQEFEKNVMQEYKQNMDVYEKMKGSPLLHVASNTFLTCSEIESEIENENFGLELQQFSSRNTIFKIFPCFSHQQRAEGIIQLKDIVYITSATEYLGRLPYLHVSKLKEDQSIKNQNEEELENQNKQQQTENQNKSENELKMKNNMGIITSVSQFVNQNDNKKQNYNFLQLQKKTGQTTSQIEQFEDKSDVRKSFQELTQVQAWQKSSYIALEQSNETPPDPQTINSINEDLNHMREIQQQKQQGQQKKLMQSYREQPSRQFERQFQTDTVGTVEMNNQPMKQNTQLQLKKETSLTYQMNNMSQIGQYNTNQRLQNEIINNTSTCKQKDKDQAAFDRINQNQEANVSLEQKTKWRIIPYTDQIDNDNFLLYGDAVWLNHIESCFTLIIKKLTEQDFYVTVDSSSRKDQLSKYEGNTNGMWIIEHENLTKGGMISWEDRFFLRNFSSGKYLSIHNVEKQAAAFISIDCPDAYSLFMFTPTSTSNENRSFITKDSFFFIKSCLQNSWIHIKEKQEESDKYDIKKGFVKESLLLEMKYEQPLDEDAFKVIRATMTEVLEANFLISCFPILKSSFNKLERIRGQEKELQKNHPDIQKKLNILKTCLEDLDKFCKNQIITTSIEHEVSNYGKLNQSRQKVLAEQYYIDIVVALIKELLYEHELEQLMKIKKKEIKAKIASKIKSCLHKKNSKIDLEVIDKQLEKKKQLLISQRQKNKKQSDIFFNVIKDFSEYQRNSYINYIKQKLSITKVAYQLLTSICKQNPTNEKYMFDYKIKDFQYQAKYLKEAVDCIIQIIGNNEKIINDLLDQVKQKERDLRQYTSEFILKFVYNSLQIFQIVQNVQLCNIKTLINFLIKQNREQENEKNNDESNQIGNIYSNGNPKSSNFGKNIGKNESRVLKKQNTFILNKDQEATEKMQDIFIFFVNLVKECPPEKRSPHFLRFFRTICSFKGKGVSVNQEFIYECIKNVIGLDKSLFIGMQLNENNEMLIQFTDKAKIILNENLVGNNYKEVFIDSKVKYLIQQIEFYSDLCLSRNYLWNNKMMNIFPFEYIIKQICDAKLDEQIRSAFCNLALSVYIDQEPLSEIILPQMCRVYNSLQYNKQQPTMISSENFIVEFANKDNTFESKRDSFNQLLTFTIKYLEEQVEGIIAKKDNDENQNKSNQANENSNIKNRNVLSHNPSIKFQIPLQENDQQPEAQQMENRLSNLLTFNIVKVLINMIKLNILSIMQKNSLYPQIINNLVKLLEYDHNNYNISLSLYKKREERYEKQINIILENKLIAGIKGIKNKLKEAAAGVVEKTNKYTQKTFKMVGQLMGITYKKRKIIEEEFSDYNENFFSSNPLVGGLVSLILLIKNGDEEQNKDAKKLQVEINTKLEICEILQFMQNLRHDFLISNFLSWFAKLDMKQNQFQKLNMELLYFQIKQKGKEDRFKLKDDQTDYDSRLEQAVQDDLSTVIPNVCRTGIELIDLAYKPLEKKNIINIQLEKMWQNDELIQQRKRNKPKKFEIYTTQNDIFIPDLDTLITGKNETIIPQEILPSLLTTFYLMNDSVLEDKILEVIFNQSNQTQKFFQNLENLEVLFESKDILPFKILQSQIHKLRYLSERSEMWLETYFQQPYIGLNENSDLIETIKTLNDIDALFFSQTTVNIDGNLQISKFYMQYQYQIAKQTNPYYLQEIQKEFILQIDGTRQKIFTFLQGHMPIINLIKDSQNQMAKFLKLQNETKADQKVPIVKLLRYLYQILTHFCYGIEENQKILAKPEYLSFFLDELSIDFGQFDLLNAIYLNNKFLCQSFPDSLFNQLKNAIKQVGRQPRFIQLLKIIQQYQIPNQKATLHLIENQIRVFRWLLPSDYSEKHIIKEHNYLLYGQIDDEKVKKVLRFDLSLPSDQLDGESVNDQQENSHRNDLDKEMHKSQSQKKVYIDAPFYFHAVLIDIFISTIEGDEGYNLNINKILEMVDLEYMFSFLLEDDDFLEESSINLQEFQFNLNSQKDYQSQFQNQKLQERYLYDKSVHFQVKSPAEGFSLLKTKTLILIKKAFLNSQSPHLETLLIQLSNIIKLIKNETNRLRIAPLYSEDFNADRYLEYFAECFIVFCLAYLKAIARSNNEIDEIKEREDIKSLYELGQTLIAKKGDLQNKATPYQYKVIHEYMVYINKIDPSLLKQFNNPENLVVPSPSIKKQNHYQREDIDVSYFIILSLYRFDYFN